MLSNQDKLKWFMMVVAGSLFTATIIAKLFQPDTEVSTISYVFVTISGLVLGSSAIMFNRKDKD